VAYPGDEGLHAEYVPNLSMGVVNRQLKVSLTVRLPDGCSAN
jgi:hypothetical protein